jgi:hypothetical protein
MHPCSHRHSLLLLRIHLNRLKRIPPRLARLPLSPLLNIRFHLLTSVLFPLDRLAPRAPIRHNARPRPTHEVFVL